MNRNRIKRAAAEAAGWICALAVWIVVAAMECGVLRPVAGAALGLGLELVGALALYKAGVVRFPDTGNAPHQSPAAPASPRFRRRRETSSGGVHEACRTGSIRLLSEKRGRKGRSR